MNKTVPAIAFALCLSGSASGVELYSTDFESFTVGDDQLVGTDGWLGSNNGSGLHGIDQLIDGLGKSAFLGGAPTFQQRTVVFRPFDEEPVSEGRTAVTFEVFFGIQDSTTPFRDRFFLSVYNADLEFLAAVRFDNTEAQFGVWRDDGEVAFDTGDVFFRDEVMFLSAEIDFATNRWSAFLDEIPIFENAPFTATGLPLTLGAVAAEWQLGAGIAGDNFMLFDEWTVLAEAPVVETPFTVAIAIDAQSRPVLTWQGEPGFVYQVEYSEDLTNWNDNLPGSTLDSGGITAPLTYTDETIQTGDLKRHYRIARTSQ